MKKKIYDIFISYRRKGGDATARLFYESLTKLGYRVSFDMETLRSGKFNAQLFQRIEECKDVIVLLSEGALDLRENREDDWFRIEVAHALKYGKNIIPVFLRDFKRSETPLPDDIAELIEHEGVTASDEHYDSTLDRICRLLTAKPHRSSVKWCALATLGVAMLGFCVWMSLGGRSVLFPYPFTHQEKQDANLVVANIMRQAFAYNAIIAARSAFFRQVHDAVSANSAAAFEKACGTFFTALHSSNVYACKPSDEEMAAARRAPLSIAEFDAFFPLLENQLEDSTRQLSRYKSRVKKLSRSDHAEFIGGCQLQLQCDQVWADAYAYCIMGLLAQFSEESLSELKNKAAPQMTSISKLSLPWLDQQAAEKAGEVAVNKARALIGERVAQVGMLNQEVRELEEQFLQQQVKSVPAGSNANEVIEKLIDIRDKQSALDELKFQIEEIDSNIEANHIKARMKFKPQTGDASSTLWAKGLRLASLQQYDLALKAIDMIASRNERNYPEKACHTMMALLKLEGKSPFKDGVMVLFFEPPATTHAIFKPGDIVVSRDGKAIEKFADCRAVDGSVYGIYRLDDSGTFRYHESKMPPGQPRIALVDVSDKI